MATENFKNVGSILHKPYWSYTEIIELATYRRFKGDSHSDENDVTDFKIRLISELKEAILCKTIPPVDLVKNERWRDRYSCYIDPTMQMMVTCGLFTLAYVGQKVLNSIPGGRRAFKPGYDPSYFVFELAISTYLIFCIGWLAFLAYRYISKSRCKSPNAKLNYLKDDAYFRGFTETFYESETVIDFLNARFSLKLEKDPFRVWQEPFFKRNGEYWIVGYAGKRLCLKEKVVHEQIAYLLSNPNKEIDCRDFAKANPDLIGIHPQENDKPLEGYEKFANEVRKSKPSKKSLDELVSYLEESDEDDDILSKKGKIAFLKSYIRENYTKDGKERAIRDDSEKSKDRIEKGIDRFIDGLKKYHPFLAKHLAETITRSYTVSYKPPEEIYWDVTF